jgi:glycosyltransferase involved in cell wall biosynthesis
MIKILPKKNRLCVLIPAFNEELNIKQVIYEIKKNNKKLKIIVIDDGSTDATGILAKKAGARVLTSNKNCGTGKALQKGFRYALKNNFSFIFQMDADGQHDPRDLKKLIKKMKSVNADMVIGSRYIKKTVYKTPLRRFLCIKFLSIILNIFFKIKIADPTSGYRLFNRKAVGFLLDHYKDGYPEVLSIAALTTAGYKIEEVSVNMRCRFNGKSSLSNISGFLCFINNILEILKYYFMFKIKLDF